jgi:Bacterial Ig-like domain (group 1).
MNARVRYRIASLAAAALLTMALGIAPVAGGVSAGSVVVLSTTLVDGATGPEVTEAQALGFTVDVKTPAQWAAMTAVDFEGYRAIILADPTCSGDGTKIAAAAANAATWGPVVNGDVIIIGADPSYHYGSVTGAHDLVHKGIALATGQSGKTGAYITLSCYYASAPAHTAVPMLAGLSSFGGFTTVGVSGYDTVHIVASAPALAGLTDALLSNWRSTVHEAIDSWPSDFLPYAIATTGTVYTSTDGVVGTPFILTRGPSVKAISSVALDAPANGTNGSPVTLTATVVVNDSPVAGVTVTFTATSGRDKGVLGTGITDASGVATLSFTGTDDAVDVVVASYTSGEKTFTSGPSIITWAAPAATPSPDPSTSAGPTPTDPPSATPTPTPTPTPAPTPTKTPPPTATGDRSQPATTSFTLLAWLALASIFALAFLVHVRRRAA